MRLGASSGKGSMPRERNVRSYVLRVLDTLNYFYSFRDLEKLLGVPFQSLWRYVNLLSIPEERTAERILERVKKLNLIETAAREALEEVGDEIWRLARTPGFIQLFSIVAEEVIGVEKLNTVVAVTEEALSLATATAMELEAEVCYASERVRLEKRGFLTAQYRSRRYNELRFLAIPRSCVRDGGRSALIDTVLEDIDRISAIVTLLKRARNEVLGYVAIAARREDLELVRSMGVERVRAVKLL